MTACYRCSTSAVVGVYDAESDDTVFECAACGALQPWRGEEAPIQPNHRRLRSKEQGPMTANGVAVMELNRATDWVTVAHARYRELAQQVAAMEAMRDEMMMLRRVLAMAGKPVSGDEIASSASSPRWLPEDEATLLRLADEGVPVPEIAERLGRPLQGARKKLADMRRTRQARQEPAA